jgi:hypothetical protein
MGRESTQRPIIKSLAKTICFVTILCESLLGVSNFKKFHPLVPLSTHALMGMDVYLLCGPITTRGLRETEKSCRITSLFNSFSTIGVFSGTLHRFSFTPSFHSFIFPCGRSFGQVSDNLSTSTSTS